MIWVLIVIAILVFVLVLSNQEAVLKLGDVAGFLIFAACWLGGAAIVLFAIFVFFGALI